MNPAKRKKMLKINALKEKKAEEALAQQAPVEVKPEPVVVPEPVVQVEEAPAVVESQPVVNKKTKKAV